MNNKKKVFIPFEEEIDKTKEFRDDYYGYQHKQCTTYDFVKRQYGGNNAIVTTHYHPELNQAIHNGNGAYTNIWPFYVLKRFVKDFDDVDCVEFKVYDYSVKKCLCKKVYHEKENMEMTNEQFWEQDIVQDDIYPTVDYVRDMLHISDPDDEEEEDEKKNEKKKK